MSFLEMRERVTDMCSEDVAWMSGKMESFSTKRFMDAGEESRRWCRELYKGKEKKLRRS